MCVELIDEVRVINDSVGSLVPLEDLDVLLAAHVEEAQRDASAWRARPQLDAGDPHVVS
jgi:hypothetical protein